MAACLVTLSAGNVAATDRAAPRTALTPLRAVGTGELVHRLLVVEVAGRRPHSVSEADAAFNQERYGVATPAEVVRTFRPGGVIYYDRNVSTVAQVTRLSEGLQTAAAREGYRLLLMTDQEGGRVSRLPGPVAEGQPAAASYDGNTRAGRRDARRVGEAMREMGVLVDLAPVADVDTVGDQGVIGERSFGSTPEIVSAMVTAQVCGYHAGGVATTLKHWPGHGSTSVDSHKSLPTLHLPLRRWKREHVPPFRTGIADGTDLVMLGHLAYPDLDPSGLPASLSPVLDREWLRSRLGFTGVVITDALTMGALDGFGGSAELATMAAGAGADLLLTPARPRAAARALASAVGLGELDRAEVEASVARATVLQDKVGLVDGEQELSRC